MKAVMTALASLAMAAGLAAAQGQSQQGQAQPGTRTDYGTSRLQKRGSDQTYNTGSTGQNVGKDNQPQTYTNGQAAQPIPQRRRRAAPGTGVASGFVAAGVGLALLGLFVRKRTRNHPDDPRYRGP